MKYKTGQILMINDIFIIDDKEFSDESMAITGELKILSVINDGEQYPYIVQFNNGYRMAMNEDEIDDIVA